MNILSVFLFPAAAILAGLQAYRLFRRRGEAPEKPDTLGWLLFAAAVICLAVGIACQFLPGDALKLSPGSISLSGGSEYDRNWWLNADGTPATGWVEANGHRYYLGDDGQIRTGWVELEGNRYYFHEDGVMATGRTEVDGEVFFFTSTGIQTLLVNPWNPVPEDYTPDLVAMDEQYGHAHLQIDSSCLDALEEMIDACNAESGSRAYVLSAYRSLEDQQQLYDRKVRDLVSQGLSHTDAEREAATVVAIPGTSEHHLGLAVDIIDTGRWKLDEGQADTAAQQWLMENSWRYGFIFRYPKDKIEITGIIYEPWHYRYVGTALAEELHGLGLTMEEYFDSLS